MGAKRGKKPGTYALYKKEDLVMIGSVDELADFTGLKKTSIYYYTTATYKRKAEAMKKQTVGYVVTKMEDDDDEEDF